MNALELRRRTLGKGVYKKTVEGNPAIAQGSLARRYPDITMQGWTEQAQYEGNQLFVASAFSSIYEKGGATVSNNGDGSFTVSGDGTLTETFSFSFALSSELLAELKQALTPGVIHFNAGDVTYPYIQISISLSDGDAISFYNSSVSSIDRNITQEQIDTISEIRYFLYSNVGSNIVPGTMKPMLYQSGDGTFEPYTGGQPSPNPDYPQPITNAGKYNEGTQKYEYQVKLTGANLFDISKVITNSGLLTNNGDGTLTATPGSGDSAVSGKAPITLGDYCPELISGKTYRLSANTTGTIKQIYLLGVNNTWGYGTSRTITDADLESEFFFYASGVNSEAVISDIMITEVEDADYEPYRTPQTVTLTSDRPLTKWDKLEKRNGQWGWVYKSGSYTVTGEEGFISASSQYIGSISSDAYFNNNEMVSLPSGSTRETSFCEQLSWYSGIWGNDGKVGYTCNNNQIHMRLLNSDTGVTEGDNLTTVPAKIKAYVAQQYEEGNPFIFLYETTEEIFVPLSSSEQELMNALYTFRPTTVLSNNCDCNMTLTYKTKKSLEVTT